VETANIIEQEKSKRRGNRKQGSDREKLLTSAEGRKGGERWDIEEPGHREKTKKIGRTGRRCCEKIGQRGTKQ